MNIITKYRSYFLGGILWLAAIASIFIIADKKFPKKPKLDVDLKAEQNIIEIMFKKLSEEEKVQLNSYEGGFIKLSDGQYHLIRNLSDGNEIQLIEKGLLVIKEMPQSEENPVIAERRHKVQFAFSQLNTAERVCQLYKRALLFYRDGRIYLAFDPRAYGEYVKRYGSDCPSCEEKDKAKPEMKGGE